MNFFQKLKFKKEIKKHINRPLDIEEILSRERNENVVVDTYEFFMRRSGWVIDGRFSDTVKTFLLCVLYDGEVAGGGISQFLLESSGKHAHQTADALHAVGAFESEALLRKSFSLVPHSAVPEDDETRNEILLNNGKADDLLEELDENAYTQDIQSLCLKYLSDRKEHFLSFK